MEKKSIWVVTFHFGRGHVEVLEYDHKDHAASAMLIAVFKNDDCINASVYRKDIEIKKES
jgi:hypothetical protein